MVYRNIYLESLIYKVNDVIGLTKIEHNLKIKSAINVYICPALMENEKVKIQ